MRKYKLVKEKKVTYPLDEWHEVERRAADLLMKTGTYIRQISVKGQIVNCNFKDVTAVMNALRIIGKNINQLAKKVNEINSIYAEDYENFKKEYKKNLPYIKSISINQTVNRSIAYILNPDKTEDLMYATSLNCLTNAADAHLAMRTVYEHFSGYKFNEPIPLKGKGRVKAIHYIQSFDPQDNVSPELAHKIAKAFARKTFGDDCQIVIATHCDKQR